MTGGVNEMWAVGIVSAECVGAVAVGLMLGGIAGRLAPITLIAASALSCGLIFLAIVSQPSVEVAALLAAPLALTVLSVFLSAGSLMLPDGVGLARAAPAMLIACLPAAVALLAAGLLSLIANVAGVMPFITLAAGAMLLAGVAARAASGWR